MHRRAARLDGEDRLDELRPLIGDRPAERAGLRMRQHDRRADLVEQRDQRVAVDLLLLGEAHQRGKLRGVERVEIRIARLAGAGPLRVVLRLRPLIVALGRDEALQRALEIRLRHRPHARRPVAGAAARDLIDYVDGIAAAHEILRPAFAAVRRAGEIGAGLAAAVDHDDGVGVKLLLRDHEFGVEVPDHRRALDRRIDLAAGEQIAGLRQRHWRAGRIGVARRNPRDGRETRGGEPANDFHADSAPVCAHGFPLIVWLAARLFRPARGYNARRASRYSDLPIAAAQLRGG